MFLSDYQAVWVLWLSVTVRHRERGLYCIFFVSTKKISKFKIKNTVSVEFILISCHHKAEPPWVGDHKNLKTEFNDWQWPQAMCRDWAVCCNACSHFSHWSFNGFIVRHYYSFVPMRSQPIKTEHTVDLRCLCLTTSSVGSYWTLPSGHTLH